MHLLASIVVTPSPELAGAPDQRTPAIIGGTLLLYGSLMLSQAIESVTRAFYARGDLDLILSSPAPASRLFAVRIGAMTASVMGMALVLGAPVINVLAFSAGPKWLAAYGVITALAMTAVAGSAVATVLLFALIGARRTRVVAQIVAAVVGAGFVICVQFFAIVSIGSMSRIEFLSSEQVMRHLPAADSLVWLPAAAAAGDLWALAAVMAAGGLLLGVAVRFCAPRFATLALATAAVSANPSRSGWRWRWHRSTFRPRTPAQALRSKEWVLLRRDPWLISQSLMQLLYLLPPFFLLWQTYYGGGNGANLMVPVLIMAAGQLAGGLAWLAVSGEDARDLIGSAPVTTAAVWRAKTEAVAGVLGLVFGPAVALLAFVEPSLALVSLVGIVTAATSATLIQFWFRAQVKRSLFRRRHVSSRIATFAEAFSSITWSSAGAVALVNPWLALIPGAAALAVLAGTWSISPRRS
jgi:ABC-2 type transport system permease protein